LRFTVTAEGPVRFPLLLRIPAWATDAVLRVAEGEIIRPEPGTFYRVDREWSDTTEVLLALPMSSSLPRRFSGAVAIERGPLIYALKVGEDWRRVHEEQPFRELPHADWEVYPTTPWNYGLDVSEATLADDVSFTESPVGNCPFSPEGAPVLATAKGKRVPQWRMENGSAADVPQGLITSSELMEELTLIPYGCTNLRISEFPVLTRGKRDEPT
jgi:hypothetical protein